VRQCIIRPVAVISGQRNGAVSPQRIASANVPMIPARADFLILVLGEFPTGKPAIDQPRDRRLITVSDSNLDGYQHERCAGLRFLVRGLLQSDRVKVKIWNISQRDLTRDLHRAPEFDQSTFFKRVYEEGIGSFGGEPVGCIILDYPLTTSTDDMDLLDGASSIAEAASAVLLADVAPRFFHIDSWRELNPDLSVEWLEATGLNSKWKELRGSPFAGYLFPLMPRCRMADETFSPAYVLGSVIGRAFADADLPSIMQRLFDSRPLPEQALPEWSCPEGAAAALAKIGLTVVDEHLLSQPDVLSRIRPAMTPPKSSPASLAERLAENHLHHLWSEYRFQKRITRGPNEAARLLYDWSNAMTVRTKQEPLRYVPDVAAVTGKLLHSMRGWHAWAAKVVFVTDAIGSSGSIETSLMAELSIVSSASLTSTSQDTRRDVHVQAPGMPDKVPIAVRGIQDFEPQSVAWSFGLGPLLEDRQKLVDLAYYAAMHRERENSLSAFARNRGGLSGLATRIQGWLSAVAAGADTPVPPEEIRDTLGQWLVTDWSADTALRVLDSFIRENDITPKRRLDGLVEALAAIDNSISSTMPVVYKDRSFRAIETSRRALYQAVVALDQGRPVETWLIEIEWSRIRNGRSFVTKTRYGQRGYLAKSLRLQWLHPSDPPFLFVVDYPMQAGTPEIETLKRILRITARRRYAYRDSADGNESSDADGARRGALERETHSRSAGRALRVDCSMAQPRQRASQRPNAGRQVRRPAAHHRIGHAGTS
jgi:hypothetical protein